MQSPRPHNQPKKIEIWPHKYNAEQAVVIGISTKSMRREGKPERKREINFHWGEALFLNKTFCFSDKKYTCSV